MGTYDYLYSKEALNIFFFLFSSEKLDKKQKDKLKELLYVICMYNMNQIKNNELIYLKIFLERINSVQELDNLLYKENPINKMYQLFPLHEELKQAGIMEKYQECFSKLKEYILKSDFDELKNFLETKNYVDDACQKIYNNRITLEECKQIEAEINEKLVYLGQYLEKNDIEAYKVYFKIRTEEIMPEISYEVKSVLKVKNEDATFSEMLQLKDLQDKTEAARSGENNYFEDVKLGKSETKMINSFLVREIIKQSPVMISLYIIISTIITKGLISNTNNLLIKSVLIMLIIFLSIFMVSTFKYIYIFIFRNRLIKGKIGFVANVKKSFGRK